MNAVTRQSLQILRALAGTPDGARAICLLADEMQRAPVQMADATEQERGPIITSLIDSLFWRDIGSERR
jgi:hypothetical protein